MEKAELPDEGDASMEMKKTKVNTSSVKGDASMEMKKMKDRKNFLEKREGMASRGLFQRRSGMEVFAFVPQKDQEEFTRYLYHQYNYWE